jgi:hypothetical protein
MPDEIVTGRHRTRCRVKIASGGQLTDDGDVEIEFATA